MGHASSTDIESSHSMPKAHGGRNRHNTQTLAGFQNYQQPTNASVTTVTAVTASQYRGAAWWPLYLPLFCPAALGCRHRIIHNKLFIEEDTKRKTRILRQIHMVQLFQLECARKSRQYIQLNFLEQEYSCTGMTFCPCRLGQL